MCFKQVSRVFKESFKGVSKKIEGCFNGVLSGFQRCLKEVQWVFEKNKTLLDYDLQHLKTRGIDYSILLCTKTS